MPMWMSWVNPHRQKRERVYNFFDRDSPQGTTAIELAKKHLSIRFSTSTARIPGFQTEDAPWIPPTVNCDDSLSPSAEVEASEPSTACV